MLVIAVENAPSALRGRLGLWLTEVTTGVYVGAYSKRVRERLWKETGQLIGAGRAVAAWPSPASETGFAIARTGHQT